MPTIDVISRANSEYLERIYQQYQADPRTVSPEWRAYFAGFEMGKTDGPARTDAGRTVPRSSADGRPRAHPDSIDPALSLTVELADLVHSYRELGHYVANLDPLGHNRPSHPLLELSEFGLRLADLDRRVGASTFLGPTDGTLRDLIAKLRTTYCGTIGVEYMDISNKQQRDWLQQRMEPILNQPQLTRDQRRWILEQIACAQGFEEYLHSRFVGHKRFSLEGGEALIPLLNTLVEHAAEQGVEEICMGMAHRGRLNVLAHVMHKPYEAILGEFEGRYSAPGNEEGDGDVKYHLGYSMDRVCESGRKIHLALGFNPSHLELVNPVIEGIVRGKQYHLGDTERTRVVPILIHGDAAFTGQGIVQETLGLSELPYWRTGGTIHVIVNNQIGFTTMPKQARFTPYPTDVAKAIQAPVFHVNGDDPEAVVHVARLAIAFRQQFHCDVMIDLWCYRRHGHNEVDEPSFTQPLMYRQIASHPRPRELYARRLIETAVVSEAEVEQIKTQQVARLDRALELARQGAIPVHDPNQLNGLWSNIKRAGADWSARTAVPASKLRFIGEMATRVPPGFTPHDKIKRLLAQRLEMAQGKAPIDWGGAEMLALGSLVLEGTPVRFVGQDAQRGTFSHRHACLHDVQTGKKYYPLANLAENQAPIAICNTMLSELAVLGFEYGFSSADPRNLVVWEAQFGDFVNGAQPIIDQFILAAESKWGKMSGLVMLLPHGYEGQGPEHSNAYLERFLAGCAENNVQVCVPTLPAQYFHLLRRQMLRSFRKPLILMMPKSLLRHEMSVSRLEELTQGSFQLVIDDPAVQEREKVTRVLLCAGKVYFTLQANRHRMVKDNVALVRVEQLYPFPQKELGAVLSRYRSAEEVCWVQEEPKNRGAWTFMDARLRAMLPDHLVLTCHARDEAASPAVGNYKLHQIEEEELVAHALELSPAKGEDRTEPLRPSAAPAGQSNTQEPNAAAAVASAQAPQK